MTHLTGFACPPARRASRSGALYRKRSATPRAVKQTRSNESLSTLLGIKAFKGSQNYPIPAGVKLSDFGSVVVWCEQFGVLISPARLIFEGLIFEG